jgi:polyisoprenoid-binding protein YceI
MKISLTRTILASLVLVSILFAQTDAFATGFNLGAKGAKAIKLDNKIGNNQAQFNSKAPLEDINGTASVNGSFTIDPANIEATTGKIAVPVNSMQTGVELRNKHILGKDWLDEESYKEVTFDIKKISGVQLVSSGGGKGIAKGMAEGTFSLHGVAKTLSFPIEITYIEKGGGDLVMIKTEFTVALKDYNIAGKKGIVGSKVAETITVKVSMFGSAGA